MLRAHTGERDEFGMLPNEMHTILDCMRWTASRFEAAGLYFGHGTDNALDEAAALVLNTLHLPPDVSALYLNARVSSEERDAIGERVRERIETRRPLPYILGEAWFAGLAFRVDERVLIPRSPFAELIEAGFEPWLDPAAIRRIADIGTGCGCIAIACAHALPEARVDALDNSEAALHVAAANIADHGMEDRVRPLQSDLLAAIPPGPAYDLIVANPPYVDRDGMSDLPPEFAHEPRAALAGGGDGLDLVHPLLAQAAQRLTTGGVLVCEVGYSWPALERAYPDLPLTWLEFERGGVGVFLVTAADLRRQFPAAG